jgi:hypothetical protein
MGETRVDLLHLLEDLRDAYPGSLEETILTEIMANALDSGASQITFTSDPAERTLVATDNGSGMKRRELARYHDVAASTKTRGEGIGFAGVGIKLGLLVCEEVLTETRRGKSYVASTWRMVSRHRAPWKWIAPLGLISRQGTGVRLKLHNALSPLLDPGYLEATLRRSYRPLLDPALDDFLSTRYPAGVAIHINGRRLEKQRWAAPSCAPLEIRLLRKRKPSAFGYLVRQDTPIAEERRGLAISTFGKVIKHGWDWLGMTPAVADRVGGLIEAPQLAASLTLNKGDFIRVGMRGAAYLAFRKAIQEAVSKQLAAWGDARPPTEESPPREIRPLQRDLAQLLEDLACDFPLLASLVERRSGGQKKLPMGTNGKATDARQFVMASISDGLESGVGEMTPSEGRTDETADEVREGRESNETVEAKRPPAILMEGNPKARRPAHYGLDIQFEDRPEEAELGRLVESTVWVNRAHPAYRRALASRSIGYHIALAVALALAPLAVEPAHEHGFVTAFLSRWGEAITRPKRTRSKR